MVFTPEDFGAQPDKSHWHYVGSADKPIIEIDFVYGVLVARHADGTHSLFVTPEDRAELTGKLS